MIFKFSEEISFTFVMKKKFMKRLNFVREWIYTKTKEKWLNESIKAIIALDNNKIIACLPGQIKKIKPQKVLKI